MFSCLGVVYESPPHLSGVGAGGRGLCWFSCLVVFFLRYRSYVVTFVNPVTKQLTGKNVSEKILIQEGLESILIPFRNRDGSLAENDLAPFYQVHMLQVYNEGAVYPHKCGCR